MEKKKPQINLTNILSFIEGNTQLALESLKYQPLHLQEQIAYRRYLCKDDCALTNQCKYCGCDFKGKTSVRVSCNKGERFPDLMGKHEWELYKEKNGIK